MPVAPVPTRVLATTARALSVVMAALLVLALVVPATATRVRTDLERFAEERFLVHHDNARGSRGPLQEYRDMRDVARRWSDQMAGEGHLHHNPRFAEEVCCHEVVGENVGYGPIGASLDEAAVVRAVDDLFTELMASPGHRENIVNPDFEQVGIGITFRESGGTWALWATMLFRAPDGTEPSPGVPRARDIADTCGSDDRPSFGDVPRDSVHAATIACIENAGITAGRGDGSYGAKDYLTRGQVATFLLRTLLVSGAQQPPGRPCTDGPHREGMSAMIEWGIFPSGSCDESARVGRSEMAVWSIRAMEGPLGVGMPNVEWDHFFDDNQLSGSTQGSHNAIAELGVVTGVGNEKFAPTLWLRRDQMATFLARILDAAADA